ncbi:hypothetical protein AKJ09_00375 [Labilithrix luteola]|uniref:Uncharacterized protein n=1 Tax=Labilithrix luteola TaxID=1391654 RepID=A0A0K1PJZ9_9BACT|nr:hypothetical protein AKJ09_00375 [Labilithrix luteola]
MDEQNLGVTCRMSVGSPSGHDREGSAFRSSAAGEETCSR